MPCLWISAARWARRSACAAPSASSWARASKVSQLRRGGAAGWRRPPRIEAELGARGGSTGLQAHPAEAGGGPSRATAHRLRSARFARVAEVHRLGVEVGLVVGGGSIFRGAVGQSASTSRRATTWACSRRITRSRCRPRWKAGRAARDDRHRDAPHRRAVYPPTRRATWRRGAW